MSIEDEVEHRGTLEARACVDACDLIAAVQTSDIGAIDRVAELMAEADRRGWGVVSVLARLATGVGARFRGGGEPPPHLDDEMSWIAERSSDLGLHALVASYRAWTSFSTTDPERDLFSDTQLASAVVMLERSEGSPLVRIYAHTTCGMCFGMRDLWELELGQYEAAAHIDLLAEAPALAVDPEIGKRILRPSLYNVVELEVRWASALRVRNDTDGQRKKAAIALERFAVAVEADLPPEWLADLEAFEILANALGGNPDLRRASDLANRPGARPQLRGPALTALAVGLAETDPPAALAAAHAATDALEDQPEPLSRELSLYVAAEIEGSAAGMRLVRDLTERLWTSRNVRLNAMEALLRSERFRIRSEELDRHAHLDPLTGLGNRRAFKRYLDELLSSDEHRVALILVDIDRFKAVNDTFGHLVGDEALQRLGSVLRGLVRGGDLAARLGGDEFLLLLRGTGPEVAAERAGSVIDALSQSRRASPGGPPPFAVSVGVASGDPSSLDQLMAEADRALYEAKSTGGDRVVMAGARSRGARP